jgi:hypothetical protein
MKIDVNVPSKSNKQKNFEKNIFFVGILSGTDEKSSIRQWNGSADPDPYPNVKDRVHNTG